MLRFILQNSGIGEVFGNFVGSLPLPMVLVAFLVAAVVRISVGSATVSMTMAAGIIASMPMVANLTQLQLATLTIAITDRRNSVQSCKRFWILAFKVII